jgi:hypothetical protein
MFRKLRPSPAMAVALAALLVALGGVAFASIPGSDGVFKACYDRSGALRVIDASASCQSGETQTRLIGPSGLNLYRPYGSFSVTRGVVHINDQAGIKSVTRLSAGKFCVKPKLNFPEVSGVVSPGFDPNGVALAYIKVGNPDCPAGSMEVITGVLQNGKFTLKDESFGGDPIG